MNSIIEDVKNLKNNILSSKEYLEFKENSKILDNNETIINIINKIKKLQQVIVSKEERNLNKDKEEIELQSLYKKLNTFEEYTNYIKSSKKFNEMLTYIQKTFEEYFNQFII